MTAHKSDGRPQVRWPPTSPMAAHNSDDKSDNPGQESDNPEVGQPINPTAQNSDNQELRQPRTPSTKNSDSSLVRRA